MHLQKRKTTFFRTCVYLFIFISGSVYAGTHSNLNTDGTKQSDQESCMQINHNMDISQDTTLCKNNYAIEDQGDIGVIVIKNPNVTLDCNGARLTGDGKGIAIYIKDADKVTVKNCIIDSYTYGIYAEDSHSIQILSMGNKITNVTQQVILDESTLTPEQALIPSGELDASVSRSEAEVRETPTQMVLPSLKLQFERINSKRGDLLKLFSKKEKKADHVEKSEKK